MKCDACGYEKTSKGCETPGCIKSIWMTPQVLERRKRELEEEQERERVREIQRKVFRRI